MRYLSFFSKFVGCLKMELHKCVDELRCLIREMAKEDEEERIPFFSNKTKIDATVVDDDLLRKKKTRKRKKIPNSDIDKTTLNEESLLVGSDDAKCESLVSIPRPKQTKQRKRRKKV
uniref:Uncharacterized protein orf116c n=1 Tax=Beta vulgaris subsp. maritima TaxID=350892 RepID=E8ZC35_BETVM|nr:hypothetical protein [Beta vulgaris subsp. maritima]